MLSASVQDASAHHLSVVERDLLKAKALIDEGIQTLEEKFLLATQLLQQAQALGQAPDLAQLQSHVAHALVAMQFHDITDQLITRAVARIDALQALHAPLGDELQTLAEDAQSTESGPLAEIYQKRLDHLSHETSPGRFHSMDHLSLNPGDIDLF